MPIDLKKIKLYGKEEESDTPETLNIEKLQSNINLKKEDITQDKISQFRDLIEDINKNKKDKKRHYFVKKLNDIIREHYKDEEYF